MRLSPEENWPRSALALMLVAGALLLGGGGSPSPIPEMLLQGLTCAGVAGWIVTGRNGQPEAHPLRSPAWRIAALLLALPALQLVPLPPAVWHALPGRDAESAALGLIGQAQTWRPWSVLPARSLAALLAMVPPAVLLVMTARLSDRGRNALVAAIALAGYLTLIVGAAQMSGSAASPLRFYIPDQPYLLGFQANHNSAADVLLIAMVAVAASAQAWAQARGQALAAGPFLAAVGGASAMLVLGIFLTASRMGVMLVPVAVLAQMVILRRWITFDRGLFIRPGIAIAALAAAALIGAAWVFLAGNTIIARVLTRFDFSGEFRPEIWKDALFVAHQYWPFGSGMGTFMPVFMAAERLEVLDPLVANRAHNDFLELAIEGGAPALIALALIAVQLVVSLWRGRQVPGGPAGPQTGFALAALLLIGLHSLVDYPLRSMALACVAAVAAGIIVSARPGARSGLSQNLESLA